MEGRCRHHYRMEICWVEDFIALHEFTCAPRSNRFVLKHIIFFFKHSTYLFCNMSHFFNTCKHLQRYALTLINIRTQSHLCEQLSISERFDRQILEIDEVNTAISLSMSTSPTTKKIAPVKF